MKSSEEIAQEVNRLDREIWVMEQQLKWEKVWHKLFRFWGSLEIEKLQNGIAWRRHRIEWIFRNQVEEAAIRIKGKYIHRPLSNGG